jgi:3-methyladenine DNA glycosylase AlkD
MTDEATEELHALFEKHKIDFAILLLPRPDGSLSAALHGVNEEQMWMVCDTVCKTQLEKKRELNG